MSHDLAPLVFSKDTNEPRITFIKLYTQQPITLYSKPAVACTKSSLLKDDESPLILE